MSERFNHAEQRRAMFRAQTPHRYAKQNGKPVVELWGPGVEGNEPLTAAQDLALIQWFKNQGCYVIVGTSWACS